MIAEALRFAAEMGPSKFEMTKGLNQARHRALIAIEGGSLAELDASKEALIEELRKLGGDGGFAGALV